ncbi:MAG: dTMP kinase [Pseudomonadota bacterium]
MDADGLFITIEGIDGSGKSTQIARLAEALCAQGRTVITTREPGGSPGAEEIRRLLVEGPPERWSAETEILLFTAARRDHMERTIAPALARGDIVLCDRFIDSTRAYQGHGPLRTMVDTLHELAIGREPDLTLLLDIDPENAFERAGQRAGGEDRFEQHGLSFQRTLRATFKDLAKAHPERIKIIDAAGDPSEVAARLLNVVTEKLGV